ncbi:MAG: hypothetical protein PHC61_15560, partial [Chitinivibrionales bacterium]|nr:hypothetical protein [Chitinivibrionales bacterium]
ALIQEIVPDEAALRSLTQSWFQFSTMYQVLKEVARSQCTVIITSDHGSILSSRPTEIYGARDLGRNARFISGEKITCDERHAVFLSDPAVFKLPQSAPGEVMAIAKENYYFKSPDKFENYSRNYHNAFHYGGISLDEMIVPLAIMTPK